MSSPFDDVASVAAHYDRLVAEHGDHRLALGWEWAHTQLVNFTQVAALDGLTSGMSVLDLGCGLGHFADFLEARDLDVDYVGWDISPQMIARARARNPGRRFEVRDVLAEPGDERFDFVVACGVLYMHLPEHERWFADMVHALFRLCRRGLAFTMLSGHFSARDPLSVDPALFYADPASILAFCLDLSPQVELDHNRLAHSFAVRVYRENTEPMHALARDLDLGRDYSPAHAAVIEHFLSFSMFEPLIEYLLTLQPSAAVWDQIGMAAFRLEDSERQISAFQKAVTMAPGEVVYARHLAIAYLDAERPHEAVTALERARAMAPDDQEIAAYLAPRGAGHSAMSRPLRRFRFGQMSRANESDK